MMTTDTATAPRLTLEVAICTMGADGIAGVSRMVAAPQRGVSYMISWQKSEGCRVPPELDGRTDVRIVKCQRRGLSANRNNALDHAQGDIILIADDDLEYRDGAFEAIRRVFEENPQLEYAAFRHDGPGERHYPAQETRLKLPLPRNYFQTSFEVALRRESRAGRLRYCEQFGLGSGRYICGEEELLLRKAIRRGVECRFFPVTIVTHPGVSTGFRQSERDAVNRVRGVLTVVDHPFSWPLRAVVRGWRSDRCMGALRCLCGAVEACVLPHVRRYLGS